MTGVMLLVALVGGGPTQTPVQTPVAEVVVNIIVHGNQVVPTQEVLRIAGLSAGDPFTAATVARVRARLLDSGQFDSVEVLKRYASIDDLSRITVVIVASEGPVRIMDAVDLTGRRQIVQRTMLRNLMFVPLFDAEDGYGATFGARVAYPRPIGPRSRLSFPLTWGGTRRAGVELERSYTSGPLSRVEVGGAIQQRRNPAYDENDRRGRLWARGEKSWGPFRAGGTAGWQRVTFGSVREDARSVAGDVTLDTRLDPVMPRNAIYAVASAERLFFDSRDAIVRTRMDGRAYVGLFGQHVLVFRGLRENNSQAAPPYLRWLLGGWSTLRGFEAGYRTGDTLVATSVEWRVPITSPLSVAKLGISVFADWGTVYEKGSRLRDQSWDQGSGASLWFAVTAFRMSVAVAHGRGAGTRFSFGGGLTF